MLCVTQPQATMRCVPQAAGHDAMDASAPKGRHRIARHGSAGDRQSELSESRRDDTTAEDLLRPQRLFRRAMPAQQLREIL
jgi:hypothetical protein